MKLDSKIPFSENFPRAKVIAIDQDPAAIMCAKQMAVDYANRVLPVRGKFGNLAELLKKNFGMSGQCIDGIVFDIGVSSYQIDQGYRGFSIRNDGPLDMRMCADKLYGEKFDELANSTVTAEYVVNSYVGKRKTKRNDTNSKIDFLEKDLATMIFEYGDERKSRRIARAIVQARERNPIKTTSQLAAIIGKGAGKYLDSIHPATRTFQALRIYVNDELAELSRGLAQATDLLKPFGSLVAVTFHSHEDRIVKRFLRKESGKVEGLGLRYHKASGPGGYRGIDAYRRTRGLTQEAKSIAEMEIAYENDTEALTFRKVGNIELMEQEKSKMANNETNQLVRMVIRTKKAISASSDEIADNSRARSAKLRVGMRKS
ncbi:hypothetical protein HK100_004066 [Physocladia obscura]|uniref:Ribosomal RNA small subunit methyltransferase H n=1 Tax=Physocladia obscura TaxID=109957 RepID=A0AAD5T794_9FUNG|nr:hypothetical protein HK100_004066 [Physocladia obscura]